MHKSGLIEKFWFIEVLDYAPVTRTFIEKLKLSSQYSSTITVPKTLRTNTVLKSFWINYSSKRP